MSRFGISHRSLLISLGMALIYSHSEIALGEECTLYDNYGNCTLSSGTSSVQVDPSLVPTDSAPPEVAEALNQTSAETARLKAQNGGESSTCETASTAAIAACSGMGNSLMMAQMIAASASKTVGTVAGAKGGGGAAIVAAGAQMLTGGTTAAMSVIAAQGCLTPAADCSAACSAAAKGTDKKAAVAAAKDVVQCNNFTTMAQLGEVQGVSAGMNAVTGAVSTYEQLKNENNSTTTPTPYTYPTTTPPATGTGGPLAAVPNPVSGWQGNTPGTTPNQVAQTADSPGGGLSSGGGYPGGAPSGSGTGGGGGSGLNNPTLGTNGGSSGGYSVGGVPFSNNGGGGSGSGKGGPDQLDLSKFLPGAERAPAGTDGNLLKAQGITAANDLSNFEKVSRMMNKKRPYMRQ